jgi:predicted nucleic acid-binding Zn ribbon protein
MIEPRPEQEEARRRQRSRALIMAWLLAAFVVLVYAISIAKMAMGG